MNIALADDGEVVYTREDGGAGVSEMSRNVDASVPRSVEGPHHLGRDGQLLLVGFIMNIA